MGKQYHINIMLIPNVLFMSTVKASVQITVNCAMFF